MEPEKSELCYGMNLFTIITTIVSILIGIVGVYYGFMQYRIAKRQAKRSQELFSKDDLVINNIPDVLEHLEQIIVTESKTSDTIEIKNFGLDLENVMPWLRNRLFFNEVIKDVHVVYKGLIVDVEDSNIKEFIDGDSNIQSSFVQASIDSAFLIENIKSRHISVAIKAYRVFPIFHGFMVNNKHLYLSFTEIQDSKIFGGNFPYIYFHYNSTSKLNKHYFNMFQTWYNYTWEVSKKIVDISK